MEGVEVTNGTPCNKNSKGVLISSKESVVAGSSVEMKKGFRRSGRRYARQVTLP
jgi:hypothetical protein